MAGESEIDILKEFFLRVEDSLIQDAASKGQKFPVSSLHFAVDANGGELYGARYIKYLISGRGPGKQPPVQNMRDWVSKNPDVLDRLRQIYKYITAEQAAFLIGRKIGREGTDIYQGKKPGVDLRGSLEKHMPDLLESIGRATVFKIAAELRAAIKV